MILLLLQADFGNQVTLFHLHPVPRRVVVTCAPISMTKHDPRPGPLLAKVHDPPFENVSRPIFFIELKVSKEITWKWHKYNFVTRFILQKILIGSTVFKPIIVICFNLLQFCPSVPSFVFVVLCKPSFTVFTVFVFIFLSNWSPLLTMPGPSTRG